MPPACRRGSVIDAPREKRFLALRRAFFTKLCRHGLAGNTARMSGHSLPSINEKRYFTKCTVKNITSRVFNSMLITFRKALFLYIDVLLQY